MILCGVTRRREVKRALIYSILMRKICLIFFCLATLTPIHSQMVVGDTSYADTSSLRPMILAGRAHQYNKEQIIKAQPTALPLSFGDTLMRYDWILLSYYTFFDGYYGDHLLASEHPRKVFPLMRITSDSLVHAYSIKRTGDGRIGYYPEGATAKYTGIVSISDTSFFMNKLIVKAEDARIYERKRILSYSNDVLIIDQFAYNLPGQPVTFRMVYMKWAKN